ncbi:hypothetical protein CH063_04523 [Colletotrichum higginsianum]|uniref:Uncharacterized protein n=1 Tax=Colletotrichum higginsianum (strain IMI 349063) TaxID=759273 RepID=H1UVR4_COLHI|nr:hypothetical protein CH63R_04722 [Colletotrichum higginsianum IMI 349063]OBR12426.1 hypothetical protein CH63R_04722 [Colletotrichum higginsianum IMI 349063]CCF32065.1 hypothetical protein CH063_04523 [Colletotrichum higginsianum]
MGLSPPVFVVLIVLATVVPPLIAGVLLSRFVCRDFRDAAGAVKSRPQRRCFGLRRVRSADSTAAKSLATRAQSYADSWQDLESLRTYRDTPTPTPSLQYCTSITVSGQVCRPQKEAPSPGIYDSDYESAADKDRYQHAEDPFKYGCIHSMGIQIIPTGSNYVLDIIQDNPTQT